MPDNSEEPPLYTLITTYIGYLVLILLGHLRFVLLSFIIKGFLWKTLQTQIVCPFDELQRLCAA
jgi:hypothetical protein